MLDGPEYQAELPKIRPKPKQTPANEARWLTGRVQPAGAWGPVSSRVPVHASLDASSGTVTWCAGPWLSHHHSAFPASLPCCTTTTALLEKRALPKIDVGPEHVPQILWPYPAFFTRLLVTSIGTQEATRPHMHAHRSVRGSKPLSAASVAGLGLTLMGPGVRQSWLDTSIDAFEAGHHRAWQASYQYDR